MAESTSNFSFMKLANATSCIEGTALLAIEGRVRRITSGICAGVETAFDEFYTEYTSRIYRFLLVLTKGNEELARELHQRVMVKAAQKMKTFSNERQLWAWLAEVARNCWKDYARKTGRDASLIEQTWLDASVGKGESEDRLISELESALTILAPEEKALVEKFYYDGCAQKDICESTGRTVKAIQCELARIRKKLKAYILKAL